LTLDVQGRADVLRRAGISLRGAVYFGQSTGDWYRLIPIRLAPVEWRFQVEQSAGQPAGREWIKPLRAWQPVDRPGFFCVSYRVDERARTLTDVLREAAIVPRLQAGAATLRAADAWQRSLPKPILPLPGDILVGEQGPRLLWLPPAPAPTVDCVLGEPEVALSLAPEIMRSASIARSDAGSGPSPIDRFALGVIALACLFELPRDDSIERLLFRAATANTLRDLVKRSDLPHWLEYFTSSKQAHALARRLTAVSPDVRIADSLIPLADALEYCAERADPQVAVQELCDFGRPLEALTLLQEVFPMAESYGLGIHAIYELQVRAGRIAGQYLSRPLEAIDFLDRAIEKLPDRPEAHEAQLKLITAAADIPILEMILRDDSASAQLDVRAWRGFRGVEAAKSVEFVYPMARYLNWRRQYSKAIPFIHERLFNAQGEYQWWEFDLNLEYVRALLGASHLDGAHEQLARVKQGLIFMRSKQGLADDAIDHYGTQCAELERLIFEACTFAVRPSGAS